MRETHLHTADTNTLLDSNAAAGTVEFDAKRGRWLKPRVEIVANEDAVARPVVQAAPANAEWPGSAPARQQYSRWADEARSGCDVHIGSPKERSLIRLREGQASPSSAYRGSNDVLVSCRRSENKFVISPLRKGIEGMQGDLADELLHRHEFDDAGAFSKVTLVRIGGVVTSRERA